jgi:hypothetical protein
MLKNNLREPKREPAREARREQGWADELCS